MGSNSKIEWTEHTFNPWMGCAKVSTGCANCYAEGIIKRTGQDAWGVHAGRKMMSDAYWEKPLSWQKKAAAADRFDRVFCASMADVFEEHRSPFVNARLLVERLRLFSLIDETPNLIWLLLTKRPENIIQYLESEALERWGGAFPDNVCIMTSVENQEQAGKRIPLLADVPATYRGLSVEPLIGPLDLSDWLITDTIDWVIVGGESGPKARPMHPFWASNLWRQCKQADIPFFFKQWGAWAPTLGRHSVDRIIGIEGKETGLHIQPMTRLGKKKAGRLLLGTEHNGHPFKHLGIE